MYKQKTSSSLKQNLNNFLANATGKVNYIVLDCEFGFFCEIIQIGAVKLDSKFRLIDKIALYIKPKKDFRIKKGYKRSRKDILERCNASDISFVDAVLQINTWLNPKVSNILCCWGDSDIVQLKKNCENNNFDFYSLHFTKYINLQKALNKCELTLSCALRTKDIKIKVPLHNALNDAINAAELIKTANVFKKYIGINRYVKLIIV